MRLRGVAEFACMPGMPWPGLAPSLRREARGAVDDLVSLRRLTRLSETESESDVIDLEIIPWIRNRVESEAVALARSIVFAEAGRLDLPLSDFSMSGRVKAKDQGVDGRTSFPTGTSVLLPTGPRVWQIKSGRSVPNAAKEFDPKHKGLHDAIKAGCGYVLFWTNDPADPAAETLKKGFTAAVQAIRADAEVSFIFADTIEALAFANLAVLAPSPTLPLRGVVSLPTWGARAGLEVAYQSDAPRDQAIAALREHAKTENPRSSSVHVFGDTGVGKTRTVYEALLDEATVDRVLVAPSMAGVDLHLLTFIAERKESRLILVVDDCTAQDRAKITEYADLARGRIRLSTIGSRHTREPQAQHTRFVELMPLTAAASREIAMSFGLSDEDADLVADHTEGYPKLAAVLAEAIAAGSPDDGLVDRVRSEPVGTVLETMLTEHGDVLHLGILSLFDRLGFDGELAGETAIVCEALGIEEAEFRELVGRELNRFVSSAGRFRLVTPRLFAVWLTSRLIKQRPKVLGEALLKLTGSLRDRIIEQMKTFAGDPTVARTLREALNQAPFTTGALSDVDEGSSRLLHVVAIVDPQLGAEIINSILDDHCTERLHNELTHSRRGIVEALEVLVWFDDTFELAATALLRLALAENETWANNATGVLHGLFRVFLGGTAVPYAKRLSWWDHAIKRFPQATQILAESLAAAFELYESRGVPDFGGRTAPPEWRPTTIGDEIAARRGAWARLIALARTQDDRDEVARILAEGIQTAAGRGLMDDVLQSLGSIEWSPVARGRFGQALGDVLQHEAIPDDIAVRIRQLQTQLVGSNLEDQLSYVLSLPPWDLHDASHPHTESPLLVQVAASLAVSEMDTIVAAARETVEGNSQTAGMIFEKIARARDDEELLIRLEAEAPVPSAALLGTLNGLSPIRDLSWQVDTLQRWLNSGLENLVIPAVHSLPPSDATAEVAIRAVREGQSPASDLGRFVYGGWTRTLDADQVSQIADLLCSSGGRIEIERGLGIISQWLSAEAERSLTNDMESVAVKLLEKSATVEGRRKSSMLALYRENVLKRLDDSGHDRVQLLIRVLENLDGFVGAQDLNSLDAVAKARGPEMIEAVLAFILDTSEGTFRPALKWLENAKVLTLLARATSADMVMGQIANVPAGRWRELVAHIDFSSVEPDELVVRFVDAATDDVAISRAAFDLIYPEMATWGEESEYLRKRLARIDAWMQQVTSDRVIAWLSGVGVEIQERIDKAELREQERG